MKCCPLLCSNNKQCTAMMQEIATSIPTFHWFIDCWIIQLLSLSSSLSLGASNVDLFPGIFPIISASERSNIQGIIKQGYWHFTLNPTLITVLKPIQCMTSIETSIDPKRCDKKWTLQCVVYKQSDIFIFL